MNRLRELASISCLACLMIFPRSFLFLKLGFLLCFLLIQLNEILVRKPFVCYFRIVFYYCIIVVMGIVWASIGLIYGNSLHFVLDNLRLWSVWGIAYALIFLLLRNINDIIIIHKSITFSGIVISLLNFVGLFDRYMGLGLFSDSIRTELEMSIGFHDGYIQIMSHNIGTLFFIVPYLFAFQISRHSNSINSRYTKFSLFLSLVLAVLSGRRALWLCIAVMPVIVLVHAKLSNTSSLLWPRARKYILSYSIAILVFFSLAFLLGVSIENATLEHLRSAFSAEDERSIQMGYLIRAFLSHPIMGSGFGAVAGYIRSAQEPWLYELSYFQLLLNLGIVGVACLLFLFGLYFSFLIKIIRKNAQETSIPFALLIGITSFLIGVYSNPYLGSFDFLLVLGFIPYLSTLDGVFKK